MESQFRASLTAIRSQVSKLPEHRPHIDRDTIVRVFGLTPAEAAVAAALCAGRSVAHHARQCGISVHTSRTLLRNAMAKTDTHQQSELVSLILSAVSR